VLHVALHLVVPALVAAVLYRRRWLRVTAILVATIVVDLDHLLAEPIYDPERCSIGFHPLHTLPAIAVYGALFLLPPLLRGRLPSARLRAAGDITSLVGLGLLIHMALDWADCLV